MAVAPFCRRSLGCLKISLRQARRQDTTLHRSIATQSKPAPGALLDHNFCTSSRNAFPNPAANIFGRPTSRQEDSQASYRLCRLQDSRSEDEPNYDRDLEQATQTGHPIPRIQTSRVDCSSIRPSSDSPCCSDRTDGPHGRAHCSFRKDAPGCSRRRRAHGNASKGG